MMGKLQGILSVAEVPQVPLAKYVCAVWLTPVDTTAFSGYCLKRPVPIVLGKFCCAQLTNSGASNVCVLFAVDVSDRNSSKSAKKNVLFLMTGPPKVAARSLRLKGL